MHGLAPSMQGGFHADSRGFWFHVFLFVAVDTVLLILQDLVVVQERKAVVERENAALRLRNIEAANLLLQQQVQPHFLFNSLSTLKSLIRFSPADAEEYVLKLSGFLRGSMANHSSALVKLEEELDLCRTYLEMQRIRFGEALQYSVEVTGPGYLPVFSLQGLIENAIKHNVLTKENPLWIRVEGHPDARQEGGEAQGEAAWRISVVNNLQPRYGVEKGGMGLANLRERYKALGGEPVVVEKGENIFSVSISVFSNESRDHRG
jgi:sensor histidine kinase YesM